MKNKKSNEVEVASVEEDKSQLKCCLCGKEIEGSLGNNPWPLAEEGLCCDDCNSKVEKARMDLQQAEPTKPGGGYVVYPESELLERLDTVHLASELIASLPTRGETRLCNGYGACCNYGEFGCQHCIAANKLYDFFKDFFLNRYPQVKKDVEEHLKKAEAEKASAKVEDVEEEKK